MNHMEIKLSTHVTLIKSGARRKVNWSPKTVVFYPLGTMFKFLRIHPIVVEICPIIIYYSHTLSSLLSISTFTFHPFPSQAAFRTDLTVLLDQVGTGKESLSFMKRRIRRLAQQWATAANRLDAKLEQRWRDQKKVKDRECWLFFCFLWL